MTSRRPARRRRRRPCHRSRRSTPTVTSAPSVSPLPTVSPKPTNWIRGCNLGRAPRRAVRAGGGPARRSRQPNGRAHVDLVRLPPRCNIRGEGVGVSTLVDRGSWVVATGVRTRGSGGTFVEITFLPRRSIHGCPLRARLVFPRTFPRFLKQTRRRRGSAVRCSTRFTVPSIRRQPDGRSSTEICVREVPRVHPN